MVNFIQLKRSKPIALRMPRGDREAWFAAISYPFDYVASAVSYPTQSEALQAAHTAYKFFETRLDPDQREAS